MAFDELSNDEMFVLVEALAREWQEVYLVSLDGAEQQRVSPRHGNVGGACFVDRGRTIAYADASEGLIYLQKLSRLLEVGIDELGSDERKIVILDRSSAIGSCENCA